VVYWLSGHTLLSPLLPDFKSNSFFLFFCWADFFFPIFSVFTLSRNSDPPSLIEPPPSYPFSTSCIASFLLSRKTLLRPMLVRRGLRHPKGPFSSPSAASLCMFPFSVPPRMSVTLLPSLPIRVFFCGMR